MACLDFGTLKFVCLLFGLFGGAFGRKKSKDTSRCEYSDSYDLSVSDSTTASQGNMVGRVNIGDSFSIEFSLTVNSIPGDEWVSVLHIGESNTERSPGIWLAPSSTSLHICLSDIDNWNTYNNVDEELELSVEYTIKFTASSDGQIICYMNDVKQFGYNDTTILTRFRSPVFIGDPWYTPFNGTVKDLVIESFDDSCATSSTSSHWANDFESFAIIGNGLVNDDESTTWTLEQWQMIVIYAYLQYLVSAHVWGG